MEFIAGKPLVTWVPDEGFMLTAICHHVPTTLESFHLHSAGRACVFRQSGRSKDLAPRTGEFQTADQRDWATTGAKSLILSVIRFAS